jgi:hypothetical protein
MRHHQVWSEQILARLSQCAVAPAFQVNLKKFDTFVLSLALMLLSISAAHAASSDMVASAAPAYTGAYSQYYAPTITTDVSANESVFVIGKTNKGSEPSKPDISISNAKSKVSKPRSQADSAKTNEESQPFASESIAGSATPLRLSPIKLPADNQGATFVTGLNTAGTVRVFNLANLEALLNVMANGAMVLGLAWAGPVLMMRFWALSSGEDQGSVPKLKMAIACVVATMATPAVINWLVASGRDAFVFIN